MGSTSNRYDDEFKAKAVSIVMSGRSLQEVASDLGISEPSLRRWVNETKAPASESQQRISELESEVKKLKKDLADTKEVADILKKSLGIFART